MRPAELTGQSFERLLVLKRHGSSKGRAMWLCECSCGSGKEVVVSTNRLVSGWTKSCGCLVFETIRRVNRDLEANGTRFKIHGAWQSNLYKLWHEMRGRCSNPRRPGYAYYGGRGIKVCDRWLRGEDGVHPFECFAVDVGPRPSRGHSLDRIDVDGDYEPGNVRWATRKEQSANRNQVASSYELKAAKARIVELERRLTECLGSSG